MTTQARGVEKKPRRSIADKDEYTFRAKPVPDYERLHMRNTLSIGPPRLLTVGQAPTLASDIRSKKREAFDREVKMK